MKDDVFLLLGTASLPVLVNALLTRDFYTQVSAVGILGRFREQAIPYVPDICRLLGDCAGNASEQLRTRAKAAEALAMIGDPTRVPASR